MRLTCITPLTSGLIEARTYDIPNQAAASDLSSDSTRLTHFSAAPRGVASPVSQRDSVVWSTPNRLAKSSWLSPTRSRAFLMSVEIMPQLCTSHRRRQRSSHYAICQPVGMRERHERLREARKRLYETAAAAVRTMAIPYGTYIGHENGSRRPDPDGWKEYARKYKVNIDWLLYETGPRDRAASYVDDMDGLTADEREDVIAYIEFVKSRRARRRDETG
jgi:hypothetical protein